MVLSVDWEGLSLFERDLQTLVQFKERWVAPLVHYMNPAYFTQKNLAGKADPETVLSVIKDEDEWGLHLHAPRHFVEAAGLNLRLSPSFSNLGDSNDGEVQGQEVMLLAYSPEEFEQMLEFSKRKFTELGFPLPQSFRAGGWMLDPDFFPILKQQGFKVDSSAAPATSLEGSCWQGESLQRYMQILWGEISQSSRPQEVLPDFYEVPNNLGAIDYWKDPEVLVNQVIEGIKNEQSCAVITIHQETASEHLGQLDFFLKNLQSKGVELEFHTNQSLLKLPTTIH